MSSDLLVSIVDGHSYLPLTKPQIIHTMCVESGDLGGHAIVPACPIHWWGRSLL